MKNLIVVASALFLSTSAAWAAEPLQLSKGREALHAMTGCYLVDYSYSEIESLKAGYPIDKRVYDVNRDKSVKEWIYATDVSANRVRLQHILFATELDGTLIEGSELKHTGEDWEYDANFLYDFSKTRTWDVKKLNPKAGVDGKWTRRVTNLDDGLRYQCEAAWDLTKAFPEWTCSSYSPIPGRETRDMGRTDYQTMDRTTRVIVYKNNWLERQDNIKTIEDPTTFARTPLAREVGKNWYVRLPDSECQPAFDFVTPGRKAFWELVIEAWDQVLVGDRTFTELLPTGRTPPRFLAMMLVEIKYENLNLQDPAIRKAAMAEVLKVISDYRI
ncbi:MAG: hypothetical protein JNL01_04225 [Bdellovibrionales bacterium]|nr:hypothetical protein [Bdellovibrionales bacterium]